MHNTPTLTATADVAADLAAVVCQRFAVVGMTCTHCEHAVTTRDRSARRGQHRRGRRQPPAP